MNIFKAEEIRRLNLSLNVLCPCINRGGVGPEGVLSETSILITLPILALKTTSAVFHRNNMCCPHSQISTNQSALMNILALCRMCMHVSSYHAVLNASSSL